MEQSEGTAGKMTGNMRLLVAMSLYGALLVACLLTLSDWRIRVVTVAIVLLFAGRTLWSPRQAAPSPVGRGADLGREEREEGEDISPM
ncbi:MAG: hypothetical protein ACRD04_14710 [Terriglobales bacterium]